MAEKKLSSFPSLSAILEKVFEDAPEDFVVLDCKLQSQTAGSSFREAVGFEPGKPKSFLDTVDRFSVSKVRESLEELRSHQASYRDPSTVANGAGSVAYSWVACRTTRATVARWWGLVGPRNRVPGTARKWNS
jgi:hypothetical protein